ncbi:hypothetical protein CHU92_13170 [Flavobacterium cyanobacteriorum]|uniref:Uncharacterized protein n=1 Tax=Flavobacterium cyanobacteriorum TaxID=2022802 RepID=A0A255YVG7_9FLAO|nr:hypothetical protein [Flavobacterium cyanobacteriorum]OYQ33208.1 hypothetical protein CHU92_13170 [Flavobacterium cyanobacteriorum]
MKIITFLILLLSPTFVFSQAKIEIDTIEVNYRIKDSIGVTSQIPQIKNGVNAVAKEKINSDIRKYFMAGITKDSAEYVNEILKQYELTTLEEYLELEDGELMPDDESEAFEITYLSDNLLNFTYSYQRLPFRGRYQFFFYSSQYDLRTGNKLKFDDFLTIEKDTLISIFRKKGYSISPQSGPDTPFLIVPIDEYDQYVEENIKYLFDKNDDFSCIDFYFIEKGNDLHLMFKFQCAGPYLADYGISMRYLQPYIMYSEFKNRFKLWGNNIYSLIGYDYLTLGNKIEFQEYTLTNTGSGFLLSNYNKAATAEYGIIICHSSTKTYHLFIKYQTVKDKKKGIITDIIELDKNELMGHLFVEFCETKNGGDSEIIALVKDRKDNSGYYTKIVKAWRANRKSGKFESVKKNKIKRCANESYGI